MLAASKCKSRCVMDSRPAASAISVHEEKKQFSIAIVNILHLAIHDMLTSSVERWSRG